jgi:hypothetical protein
MTDIPIARLIKCAARELHMRETVYPRRAQQGHMSPDEAENEIACMRAILENLKAQAPDEPLQGSLLGGSENHA